MMKNKQVTGIGGIVFKSNNPDQIKVWYKKHLGIKTDEYGATFKFRQFHQPEKSGYLQWSPMKDDTSYFSPSSHTYMINYRAEDLEELVKQLKSEGVTVLDDTETYGYGKFVYILDPEGRKIELWEPVDEVFDDYYKKDDTERYFNA